VGYRELGRRGPPKTRSVGDADGRKIHNEEEGGSLVIAVRWWYGRWRCRSITSISIISMSMSIDNIDIDIDIDIDLTTDPQDLLHHMERERKARNG
jgi:hypothetical protein